MATRPARRRASVVRRLVTLAVAGAMASTRRAPKFPPPLPPWSQFVQVRSRALQTLADAYSVSGTKPAPVSLAWVQVRGARRAGCGCRGPVARLCSWLPARLAAWSDQPCRSTRRRRIAHRRRCCSWTHPSRRQSVCGSMALRRAGMLMTSPLSSLSRCVLGLGGGNGGFWEGATQFHRSRRPCLGKTGARVVRASDGSWPTLLPLVLGRVTVGG